MQKSNLPSSYKKRGYFLSLFFYHPILDPSCLKTSPKNVPKESGFGRLMKGTGRHSRGKLHDAPGRTIFEGNPDEKGSYCWWRKSSPDEKGSNSKRHRLQIWLSRSSYLFPEILLVRKTPKFVSILWYFELSVAIYSAIVFFLQKPCSGTGLALFLCVNNCAILMSKNNFSFSILFFSKHVLLILCILAGEQNFMRYFWR